MIPGDSRLHEFPRRSDGLQVLLMRFLIRRFLRIVDRSKKPRHGPSSPSRRRNPCRRDASSSSSGSDESIALPELSAEANLVVAAVAVVVLVRCSVH